MTPSELFVWWSLSGNLVRGPEYIGRAYKRDDEWQVAYQIVVKPKTDPDIRVIIAFIGSVTEMWEVRKIKIYSTTRGMLNLNASFEDIKQYGFTL